MVLRSLDQQDRSYKGWNMGSLTGWIPRVKTISWFCPPPFFSPHLNTLLLSRKCSTDTQARVSSSTAHVPQHMSHSCHSVVGLSLASLCICAVIVGGRCLHSSVVFHLGRTDSGGMFGLGPHHWEDSYSLSNKHDNKNRSSSSRFALSPKWTSYH